MVNNAAWMGKSRLLSIKKISYLWKMEILKTTIDKISKYRKDYFDSLPQFQEAFLELMIGDCYILRIDSVETGYVILNNEGVLIEFYVSPKYISQSNKIFKQVISELSITDIYCKSFDSLLLNNCLLNLYSYSLVGLLYRDYVAPLVATAPKVTYKKSHLSSAEFLASQDDSIMELFDTKEQVAYYIQNHDVFEFYKDEVFFGCGMVIRTHPDWNFCDLGVWVAPPQRGKSLGAQIILNLREFALKNGLKPSCGCAIDNIASQKTIEKSGYISRYSVINFQL